MFVQYHLHHNHQNNSVTSIRKHLDMDTLTSMSYKIPYLRFTSKHHPESLESDMCITLSLLDGKYKYSCLLSKLPWWWVFREGWVAHSALWRNTDSVEGRQKMHKIAKQMKDRKLETRRTKVNPIIKGRQTCSVDGYEQCLLQDVPPQRPSHEGLEPSQHTHEYCTHIAPISWKVNSPIKLTNCVLYS